MNDEKDLRKELEEQKNPAESEQQEPANEATSNDTSTEKEVEPKAEETAEGTKPEADETEVTEKTEETEETAPENEEPVAEEQKQETHTSQPKPTAKGNGQDDFDWEAFERGEEYIGEKKKDIEDIYDKTLSSISDKEVVEGTVISMNKREVVINIGFKSDGVVSLNEFRYNPELKVGDNVEVYIENQEDKKGQLQLSHKKARALRSWDRVNEALEKDEVIKGYIKCRTKGGMIVDVFGIEAFLPGSQIDVKPIRDYDIYVGKTMDFKVVKINHEFKNVVVSHKALIEAELEQQKKEIISKLEKGQVLEGTVKNITSYGVFIDLGGVDGLIHITDLSWGRVNHPEEIVELDQKLNVVILDFDDDKKRIALGLKQLTPHPWDSLDPDLKVGDKVSGKVVVLADYGAFVEIAPGVEGLIHVSEMSWSQHLRSAQDFISVGDEVQAQILTLDREERKMSLGMKQLKPDPWQQVQTVYAVGTKHEATVRNFTNFGVFVEIEEGIDGLIHISDLSWTKKVKHPAEFTNIGDKIEVVVLEIDEENRRLSLGHKQLEENPWDVFETIFTQDSIHEGTVIEMSEKGGVISLPYGVEGFATPKHLVKEDGTKVKVDEKLNFKVIEFNKAAKRIIVSHSRIHEDEKRNEDQAKRRTQTKSNKTNLKKVNENVERTTLGDISELAALKNQMETSSAKATKKEEPKAEKPEAKKEDKAEETKAEEPKAEEPKVEKPKAEEPKAEESKAEEPKAEAAEEKKEAVKKEEAAEKVAKKEEAKEETKSDEKPKAEDKKSAEAEEKDADEKKDSKE